MYIKGVGMTKFGAQAESSQEMVYEATLEALYDANMSPNDIDAIVVAAIDSETTGERQSLFLGHSKEHADEEEENKCRTDKVSRRCHT